jgi:photosystem II stability/assembly factor-like uncharacterized protein
MNRKFSAKYSYTIFFLLILLAFRSQSVQQFTVLPKLSIRALEVINDNTIWFGANRGVWGYTEDSGKTWHIDSLKVDSLYPQFRSIAVLNDSTVFLLNIASPAYLFKTTNKGKTWRVVYKNTHPKAFFDSMLFTDQQNARLNGAVGQGFALGDPIEGHITLLKTTDAGETWKALEGDKIPTLTEGEACFATSNTNLDSYKNMLWFITGGKRSRLFYSSNSGTSFLSYDTPLPKGGIMTGIFSFDFLNDKIGVIAGGDYDKTDTSIISLAFTYNGGKTWKPVKSKTAFFGSCVRFKSDREVYVTGHNGTFKYNIKTDRLQEIVDNSNKLNYYTFRFSPSRKVMWMAGSGGRIALLKDLK